MGTNEIIRRRALQSGGAAIDWESIARGMISNNVQFSIGEDVAAAMEGITKVFRRCFIYRSNLVGDVYLPTSVTKLNDSEIFFGCSNVTSVTLGENVTAINATAFQEMGSKMKALVIHATTPPTLSGSNALSGTGSCIIYVPDAVVENYKTATYWSQYASRIKGISERPAGG